MTQPGTRGERYAPPVPAEAPAGSMPWPAGSAPAVAGSGNAVAESPSARAGTTGRLRQIAWASVPVWSLGLLAFVPFLRLAVARRRRKDWAVFAGYLLAVVLEIVVLSVAGNKDPGTTVAGGLVILLMGTGSVHTYLAFGNAPARAADPRPGTPEQLNREALATARGRMERRQEAREIARKNPVLSRELRIGRPDLPREYDDGGLVDVNQVPGEILQAQLGLSQAEAATVLAARAKLGSFSSADEVSTYAQLAPDRLDAIRDWIIFS